MLEVEVQGASNADETIATVAADGPHDQYGLAVGVSAETDDVRPTIGEEVCHPRDVHPPRERHIGPVLAPCGEAVPSTS